MLLDISYQTFNQQSLEAGDTDDKGFLHEDIEVEGMDDIIGAIEYELGHVPHVERSGSDFYAVDPDVDYETGEHTFYAFHLNGMTDESYLQLVEQRFNERR